MRPAVFLDRDGTLMEEVHYCADPALVRLFPGTAEALQKLREIGFINVIITNQSGIGRGKITLDQYEAVHAELLRQLACGIPTGAPIDATYYCPDAPPTASKRRKPAPGMVNEAVRDLGIDPRHSWFVGDKAADIDCGRAAGLRTILVLTGYGNEHQGHEPDFYAKDIVEAAAIILKNRNKRRTTV